MGFANGVECAHSPRTTWHGVEFWRGEGFRPFLVIGDRAWVGLLLSLEWSGVKLVGRSQRQNRDRRLR